MARGVPGVGRILGDEIRRQRAASWRTTTRAARRRPTEPPAEGGPGLPWLRSADRFGWPRSTTPTWDHGYQADGLAAGGDRMVETDDAWVVAATFGLHSSGGSALSDPFTLELAILSWDAAGNRTFACEGFCRDRFDPVSPSGVAVQVSAMGPLPAGGFLTVETVLYGAGDLSCSYVGWAHGVAPWTPPPVGEL